MLLCLVTSLSLFQNPSQLQTFPAPWWLWPTKRTLTEEDRPTAAVSDTTPCATWVLGGASISFLSNNFETCWVWRHILFPMCFALITVLFPSATPWQETHQCMWQLWSTDQFLRIWGCRTSVVTLPFFWLYNGVSPESLYLETTQRLFWWQACCHQRLKTVSGLCSIKLSLNAVKVSTGFP